MIGCPTWTFRYDYASRNRRLSTAKSVEACRFECYTKDLQRNLLTIALARLSIVDSHITMTNKIV